MGKIIAIGGSHIGETIDGKKYPADSTTLYKEIIKQSGKKNPKVLFIPTASSDSEGYCNSIKKYFNKLGCSLDNLLLIKEKYTYKQLEKKIFSADIIHVGGGNTLKMMNMWRKLKIDTILLKAYNKNIVMSGVSAGAICWFKHGNSDSRKFKNPNAGLIKVSGLKIFNLLYCPHYDKELDRKSELKKMMKKTPLIAIACDNCTALEIINNKYRIISAKKNANTYKCYWKSGKYYENKISQTKEFKPINELLKK